MKFSTIIKEFSQRFIEKYKEKLMPSHLKAMDAMKSCRSEHSPKMLASCDDCGHQELVPHSCGHRSCPHCQAHESQQWLERQLKRLVPAEYFMVTFTLPAEFRALAWRHQRAVYDKMIGCAWETLKTFSGNDKQLKGIPGAIAVLHTHQRDLGALHPHVHVIIPAAAIETKNGQRFWRIKKAKSKSQKPGQKPGQKTGQKTGQEPDQNQDQKPGQKQVKKTYLFCHKALAKVFRAKLLGALKDEGLTLPKEYPGKWVVNCKSVGSGAKALAYLGRYLYRGVIAEKNIVSCKDGKVTYRWQDSETKKMKYRTVPGEDFLWAILKHVLPRGFRRARNYGFLHPNSKRLIQVLQLISKLDPNRVLAWFRERPKMTCPSCGGVMKIIKTRIQPLLANTCPVPT